MRYLLDTNILVFHAQNGENLDKDVASILDDYENIICVSSEVIKETMHLIRYGKIDVKQWKKPNDIWKSIEEWGFNVDYVKEEHIKVELEKQLRDAEMEKAILKKAVGIFSRVSK